MRRLGRPRDRLAAPDRLAPSPSASREPDAGMGCVKRGKRQRSGHPPRHWRRRERKSNELDAETLRDAAMVSKAWPYEEARKLLKRWPDGKPGGEPILFETGYGPSGLPHIGTFQEVLRTT